MINYEILKAAWIEDQEEKKAMVEAANRLAMETEAHELNRWFDWFDCIGLRADSMSSTTDGLPTLYIDQFRIVIRHFDGLDNMLIESALLPGQTQDVDLYFRSNPSTWCKEWQRKQRAAIYDVLMFLEQKEHDCIPE